MTRVPFIVATNNEGKIHEIRELLKEVDLFHVQSMKEAGIFTNVEENGRTFQENSLIKAKTIHNQIGGYVLADDSGLVIDALDGAPGIYSARFLGEDTGYDKKNETILQMLAKTHPADRTARFVCAISCFFPDGKYYTVQETLEGIIHDRIAGENGFGYDPIFYLPEYQKTMSQLSLNEKNKISHRGKALRTMVAQLYNM